MDEVSRRLKEDYPLLTMQRMSIIHFNSFRERIERSRNYVCSKLMYLFPSNNIGFESSQRFNSTFKVLNCDDLQKICEDSACVHRVSSTGYMFVNMRYYKFNQMEAKNRWKPHHTFFCVASYDKTPETHLITGLKKCGIEEGAELENSGLDKSIALENSGTDSKTELENECPITGSNITGLTLVAITRRGPSNTGFVRRLGLDVHSSKLTSDLLMEHILYAMRLCEEKGIEFDNIVVTLPADHEHLFRNIFPHAKLIGKSLLFECFV